MFELFAYLDSYHVTLIALIMEVPFFYIQLFVFCIRESNTSL